jgi:tetratricopeptide (TPR) repeat protein
MLARREDDSEALFGLARVDAWGGCWAISEAGYWRVLAAHPRDADVRAGYADLLIWRGRLDEAERLVREGLALDPKSPAMLARAARFAYWRGDATEAVRLADEAERGAPDDADLRAMRDRLFVGEPRLTVHFDKYPVGYQDLFSVITQLLERRGRFEVYGGPQLFVRYPNRTSQTNQTFIDGRYPLGVAYHPGLGATIGGEIAPGAPSNAIPVLSLKGWALTPIVGGFDAFFAYSFWYYANSEIVHILNPAVGIALPRELRLDVRAWIAAANIQSQTKVVGAARGCRGDLHVRSRGRLVAHPLPAPLLSLARRDGVRRLALRSPRRAAAPGWRRISGRRRHLHLVFGIERLWPLLTLIRLTWEALCLQDEYRSLEASSVFAGEPRQC